MTKIKKEQLLAKAQKKTAPIYNQSQIDEMVKNEKINKLVKSQKETQLRSFLEDQDKDYTADEFGKTTRERLNIYNVQELLILHPNVQLKKLIVSFFCSKHFSFSWWSF